MRYQVPQFIEVEDKIFGSLTFKQFIYLAGGGGICVLLFTFLPNFLAAILSAPIGAFSAALAFYQMNGKPFIEVVEAFLKYSLGSKLYIWQKQPPTNTTQSTAQAPAQAPIEQVYVPKLSESKLKDISLNLDTHGNSAAQNSNPWSEKGKIQEVGNK